MGYIVSNNKVYEIVRDVPNGYEVNSDRGPFYIFIDRSFETIRKVSKLEELTDYVAYNFDSKFPEIDRIKTEDKENEVWILYDYVKHDCKGELTQFRLGMLTDKSISFFAEIDTETNKLILL